MIYIVLLLLGLCLGSFINALVYRLRRQDEIHSEHEELSAKKTSGKKLEALDTELTSLSISKGRSMCPHCKHPLAAKDLVPVLSFVWLKGKCRYCGNKIDDTPLAELLTPLLFVISYIFWPMSLAGPGLLSFILWLIFVVGFVALALYDLRWYELPHKIVLPLVGLALIQVVTIAVLYGGGFEVVISALLGALVIGGIFYALYRVSHEQWIGFGDVTLGVLIGLLAGSPAKAFMLIFIASLIGTLVAVPLLATGKATRSTHLPFGPFLILAAFIVVLFGDRLLRWYAADFMSL